MRQSTSLSCADNSLVPPHHGLTNYIDTKAECRHLKILTCTGYVVLGLKQINTCHKVPSPFAGQFFLDEDILHYLFYESHLSTPPALPHLYLFYHVGLLFYLFLSPSSLMNQTVDLPQRKPKGYRA